MSYGCCGMKDQSGVNAMVGSLLFGVFLDNQGVIVGEENVEVTS